MFNAYCLIRHRAGPVGTCKCEQDTQSLPHRLMGVARPVIIMAENILIAVKIVNISSSSISPCTLLPSVTRSE